MLDSRMVIVIGGGVLAAQISRLQTGAKRHYVAQGISVS